ncbi:hypothetical protein QUF72_20715 [Desulfobacterales bacterium HSG2]|nr:hypothetical protein [Desulfobacterales bacterium HSG2]
MKKLVMVCAALAMVGVFAGSVIATDWNFYGSARVRTFWQNNEFKEAGREWDVKEWDWDLQSNSRIGATVRTNDVIGGGFELGITSSTHTKNNPDSADADNVYTRKLYGTWDFGGGELLVGKTYTPLVKFYSDQAWKNDESLLHYGELYSGRHPMIQVKMNNFKLALIKPSTAALDGVATDKMIPKIEGSFHMKMDDALSVDLYAGFNTVEVNDSDDIRSYVVGAGAIYEMGPWTWKGKIHYAQNPANYGLAGAGAGRAHTKGDDSDSLGFLVVGNFKMDDMFSFQGGFGKSYHEAGDIDDDISSYYFQAKINMAPSFFVVPEIGRVDRGDDGETTYAGMKWQINF